MATHSQKKLRSKNSNPSGGDDPPREGPNTRSASRRNTPAPVQDPQEQNTPKEPAGAPEPTNSNLDDMYVGEPVEPRTRAQATERGNEDESVSSRHLRSGQGRRPEPTIVEEPEGDNHERGSEDTSVNPRQENRATEKLTEEQALTAIRPSTSDVRRRMDRLRSRDTSNRVYEHIFRRLMEVQRTVDNITTLQNETMMECLNILEAAEDPGREDEVDGLLREGNPPPEPEEDEEQDVETSRLHRGGINQHRMPVQDARLSEEPNRTPRVSTTEHRVRVDNRRINQGRPVGTSGGPPDDDGYDEDEGNGDRRSRDWPPHLPSNGRDVDSRMRLGRSPTPFGGANPPHSYYYRQGSALPQAETAFATGGGHSASGTRDGADTEWIRRAIREKVGSVLPEIPALSKLKLSPPTSYEGGSDIEVFDAWLAQLCRWLRLARIVGPASDSERVDVLGQVLAGPAQLWYNTVIDSPQRVERDWDFESAVVALYCRFVHQSTELTAIEKFESVKYTKTGGARQLATDIGKYAGRMATVPDEYTMRRRFWFSLPREMTRIMGTIKSFSAERNTFPELINAAVDIEDAWRAEAIGERMRSMHAPAAAVANPSTPNTSANNGGRPNNQGRPHRPDNRPKTDNKARPRFPGTNTLKSVGERRPEPSKTTTPTHNHRTHGPSGHGGNKTGPACYGCGSLTHLANNPICPVYQQKGPAVRRMEEVEEPTEHEGSAREEQDNVQETVEEWTPLEGSQYDPDEYPDEVDEPYSDDGDAWLGGMRLTTTREPSDDESDEPTEQLRSMRVTMDLRGPTGEYPAGVIVGEARARFPRSADASPPLLPTEPPATEEAIQDWWSDSRALELEIAHLRNINGELNRQMIGLQQRLCETVQEGSKLRKYNDLWMRHCGEMSTELRQFCALVRLGGCPQSTVTFMTHCERSSNARARETARAFTLFRMDPDSEEEDYDDMPPLVDEVNDGRPPIEESMGSDVDFVDTVDDTEEGGETMFAIATTGDREYRSAMEPKEIRPQRDFKCLTVYVEVNGMKGLALLDSGSSIDCVSPEFARVAELTTRPLSKPVGLQLGCVGSRSSINFGTRAKVKIGNTQKSMYLDVVNVDHYDLILGVPFLIQFGTLLDFRDETIVVGTDRIASLKPGEEQRTAKPYRRGPTGTSAKYQWATTTKPE